MGLDKGGEAVCCSQQLSQRARSVLLYEGCQVGAYISSVWSEACFIPLRIGSSACLLGVFQPRLRRSAMQHKDQVGHADSSPPRPYAVRFVNAPVYQKERAYAGTKVRLPGKALGILCLSRTHLRGSTCERPLKLAEKFDFS